MTTVYLCDCGVDYSEEGIMCSHCCTKSTKRKLALESHEASCGLLPRIEALEEKLLAMALWREGDAFRVESLEQRYELFFNKAIDCKDVNVVVRHFFRKLTPGERSKIFLSAGAVTVYISNDPVYYIDVLDGLKGDYEKSRKVFGLMHSVWASDESLVMEMGKTVTCGMCGQVIEVPSKSWLLNGGVPGPSKPSLKKANGRHEMSCPCGTFLGFLEGGCWIACQPGWSVRLAGLKKRKKVHPLLNGFEGVAEDMGEPVMMACSKGATDCPAHNVCPECACQLPKKENFEEGYSSICDYVMAHFADEQRSDQTMSAFVVEILEAVVKGNG